MNAEHFRRQIAELSATLAGRPLDEPRWGRGSSRPASTGGTSASGGSGDDDFDIPAFLRDE